MKNSAAIAGLLALTVTTVVATPAPSTHSPIHSIDLAGMDRSVKPCRDIYQFANGTWLRNTPIPPDRSFYNTGAQVNDRNQLILHSLVEEAVRDHHASESSPPGKVGAFYRAGMDVAQIEANGARPIAPEFQRIAAIYNVKELVDEMAHLERIGVDAPFSFSADQDSHDSTCEIGELKQSGLSLPSIEDYLPEDGNRHLLDQFEQHAAKMFTLLNSSQSESTAEAAQVLDLETKLAQVSMSQVDQRNPANVYHPMTVAELADAAPGMDWPRYFKGVGLDANGQKSLNIQMLGFVRSAASMALSVSIPEWKSYLRYRLIDTTAPYLSSAFVNEDFAFDGQVLTGATQLEPRWKRVVEATDGALGEDLSRLFVARRFTPEAKQRALTMVLYIKATLRDRIMHLDWIGPATRAQALAKCDAMVVKVGYPDHWRDYSTLHLTTGSYVLNILRANEFEFQRQIVKIGRPVDRSEWFMNPDVENAYYDPTMNEIVFPAGALQPPRFDALADDACNYGGIGAIIGHEMTHGFDDQGRQFDAHGNLKNWWTAEDASNFQQRAEAVIARYDAYVAIDGIHVNGKLTLGENIADIGGAKLAYLALEKSLQGKPRRMIDGFTPEQRFFIAYAQSRRGKMRPEMLRQMVTSDPHSPDPIRVKGVVSSLPEFYTAFGCPVPASATKTSIW